MNFVKRLKNKVITSLNSFKKSESDILFKKYLYFPRNTVHTIHFRDYKIWVPDVASAIHQIKETLIDKQLEFKTNTTTPVIIDCGSNVGVTCLFFGKKYPKAEIVAYEADPDLIKYLKSNLKQIEGNVTIHNKAVWVDNDSIEFGQDGADGGSIFLPSTSKIKIGSIRLKDIIDKYVQVDMLKMDVEGAETAIIIDCKDVLGKVKNIFLEYHSWINKSQELGEILKILTDNGFRYYIKEISNNKEPFLNSSLKGNNNMDLQLNIYAKRL